MLEEDKQLPSPASTYHWFTPSTLVLDTGNKNVSIPWTDLDLSAFLPFLPCLLILQAELAATAIGGVGTFIQFFVRRTGDVTSYNILVDRHLSDIPTATACWIQATNNTGKIQYAMSVGVGWTCRAKIWLKGYYLLREA